MNIKDYSGRALNTQPDDEEEGEVQPVPPAEPRE